MTGERRRILLLTIVMAVVCASAVMAAQLLLYRTALAEQRLRLSATAQSQARLIEAVARFGAARGGSMEDTLSQMRDAHEGYEASGHTEEFVLAKLEDGHIVFLFRHRREGVSESPSIPFDSALAAPMRMALSGHSGTMTGLDYRGEPVLAAYEPVRGFGMGIVAKLDLAEVRAPFIRASALAAAIASVLTFAGALLFARVTNPLIRQLHSQTHALQSEVDERRRSEAALARSEARLRRLVESDILGVLISTTRGEILEANDYVLKMLGRTRDELIGGALRWPDLTPSQFADLDAHALEELEQRGACTPFEKVYLHKSGRWVPIVIGAATLSEDKDTQICFIIDLTAQKQAEEALIEREAILNETGRMARIGGWEHDLDTGRAVWTQALYDIVEIEPGEPPGVSEHLSYYPPEDRAKLETAYGNAVESGEPFDLELRAHTATGIPLWCRGVRRTRLRGRPLCETAWHVPGHHAAQTGGD